LAAEKVLVCTNALSQGILPQPRRSPLPFRSGQCDLIAGARSCAGVRATTRSTVEFRTS
jgi:hypothetical protein